MATWESLAVTSLGTRRRYLEGLVTRGGHGLTGVIDGQGQTVSDVWEGARSSWLQVAKAPGASLLTTEGHRVHKKDRIVPGGERHLKCFDGRRREQERESRAGQ